MTKLILVRNGAVQESNARSKFDKYKKESEKGTNLIDRADFKVVKELRKIWNGPIRDFRFEVFSDKLQKKLEGIPYTKEDVEKFSIILAKLQDEPNFDIKAGFFLSSLIKLGNDTTYYILTSHLNNSISYLGINNTKNIFVEGDIGDNTGFQMYEGMIQVNGHTGNHLGAKMRGGSIHVKGNARNWIGAHMHKGAIIVEGNAEDNVGDFMYGGEITVNGDVGESLGDRMIGGKITVNGDSKKSIAKLMQGGEIHIAGNFFIDDTMAGGKIFSDGILILEK